MKSLRCYLFNICFYSYMALYCVLMSWIILLPKRYFKVWIQSLFHGIYWLEKHVLGLDYEVIGLENLPKEGPYIIASNHQSLWETMKFQLFISFPCYVQKAELFRIPFFGWLSWKGEPIAVKRESGGASIKHLLKSALEKKEEGRVIVIFPQGTRTPIGAKHSYKVGIALIYNHLNIPVVPVALNSGVFWGRNSFQKYPGKVTIKILPPIKPGLPKKDFMVKLEETIEPVAAELEKEALKTYFPERDKA